ncbi:MAG: YjbH domain-containing protein [Candidatus Paceibacterota bacterium]
MYYKITFLLFITSFVFLFLQSSNAEAQALSGVTGLFQIPTAEMMPDRSVRLSHHVVPEKYSVYGSREFGHIKYSANSATVAFLPRIELMFRYSYEMGLERGPHINLFMDRMVAARFLLFRENDRLPAVVFGLHDPGGSVGLTDNNHFTANYLVASKNLEMGSLKYGIHSGYAFDIRSQRSKEYRGLFGGLSLEHEQFEWVQLILEYDSFQFNTAVKILLMDRIQFLGGLYNMDQFAGGVSYRFQF